MRRCHLVIFVKAPMVGRAKTRLGRDIGMVRAARIARRLSAHTARTLAGDRRWSTVLAVTPDDFVRRGRWWPLSIARMAQGRGDLGLRMARAFRQVRPGPAVIVGSDIPGLTRDHVWQAFRLLRSHGAVLGPAVDGGYWLIGLARSRTLPALSGLFRDVRWSSPHALADTLAGLPPALTVAYLDTLMDLDTGADLKVAWLPVSKL